MGLSDSNERIARRYDGLAPVFRAVEWVFLMPPGLRRRAVDALNLKPGDRVLEVGCGSGRNLPLLTRAVGADGAVIGTDISAGMLRRAQAVVRRRDYRNVTLLQEDAAELNLGPVDAVLFSLSYSVMPNREHALQLAWAALEPASKLVILDAGSFSPLGRMLEGATRRMSQLTVLGDPAIHPWEELMIHAPKVHTELFFGGTYVICWADKIT